jgi:hypothetical protein
MGVLTGSFTDFWTGLTPANVAALEAGSYVITIRTAAFPAGEIQGRIAVAIPEPASLRPSDPASANEKDAQAAPPWSFGIEAGHGAFRSRAANSGSHNRLPPSPR